MTCGVLTAMQRSTMATKKKLWGIWCLTTKTWVHESTLQNEWTRTDCVFATRKAAKECMAGFTIPQTSKDYEVRKYTETL